MKKREEIARPGSLILLCVLGLLAFCGAAFAGNPPLNNVPAGSQIPVEGDSQTLLSVHDDLSDLLSDGESGGSFDFGSRPGIQPPNSICRNVLRLQPAAGSECAKPGETVVIELWQLNLSQPVAGYQAFMSFNPLCLQVVGVQPTEAPYGIVALKRWNNTTGTIDLIAGINTHSTPPQVPSQANALLATITMTVVGECCDATVGFRNHQPPTQFSDPTGNPVIPELQAAFLELDGTAPSITCRDGMELQCPEDVPEPDITVPACSDNCGSCTITWEGDSSNGGTGCVGDPLVITRTYRATDCAGNYTDCQQTFTVVDTTEPTITCPAALQFQCRADVPPPDITLLVCTDNCGLCTITWVGDADNGGTGCVGNPLIITRTYRATDFCGNHSDCTQQFTVIDTTVPTITCPPNARYQCRSEVPPCEAGTASSQFVQPKDVYIEAWGPGTIEWSHTYDHSADPVATATLAIVADDVDPDEDDGVYVWANGAWRYLGLLEKLAAPNGNNSYPGPGNPNQPLTTTVFSIDPTWLDGIPMQVQVDTAWVVEIETSTLTVTSAGGGVHATDNCDPSPDITCWDEDNGGTGCAADPLIITRHYRATDYCGNVAECTQTITVADTTKPTITCPAGLQLQCRADVPLPDTALPVCTDNCGLCTITWVGDADNGGTGCVDNPLIITRTYRATDHCGNYEDCTQQFTVADTTKPTITCPAGASFECVTLVPPPDATLPAARDNCDPAPIVTWVGDASNGGSGCSDDPLIITRTYRATDYCGNYEDCTQQFTVVDDQPPTFTNGCPPPVVKVFPNPGECYAYVTLPTPPATDGCDTQVDVLAYRSDGKNLWDPYDAGETTVWWVAVDDCDNYSAWCTQIVEVENKNLVRVYMEMPGVFQLVSRCLHFELFRCPHQFPNHTLDDMATFIPIPPPNPYSMGEAMLAVPCQQEYTCMTAQDELHTLRSTAILTTEVYENSFGFERVRYVAMYTQGAGNALIAGNLDACQNPNDWYIDILDFGVWSWQWAAHPPTNTPCVGQGGACGWFPHADINGDGTVCTADVSFIITHILWEYQPNCCGAPRAVDGPTMRISVAELIARGWGELAAGDLNEDGVLGQEDVIEYLGGKRPKVLMESLPAEPVEDGLGADSEINLE